MNLDEFISLLKEGSFDFDINLRGLVPNNYSSSRRLGFEVDNIIKLYVDGTPSQLRWINVYVQEIDDKLLLLSVVVLKAVDIDIEVRLELDGSSFNIVWMLGSQQTVLSFLIDKKNKRLETEINIEKNEHVMTTYIIPSDEQKENIVFESEFENTPIIPFPIVVRNKKNGKYLLLFNNDVTSTVIPVTLKEGFNVLVFDDKFNFELIDTTEKCKVVNPDGETKTCYVNLVDVGEIITIKVFVEGLEGCYITLDDDVKERCSDVVSLPHLNEGNTVVNFEDLKLTAVKSKRFTYLSFLSKERAGRLFGISSTLDWYLF